MNVEQRYRLLYKPAVFAASLVPLAWLLLSLFGWLGFSAGVDPVKFLELECGQTTLNFLFLTLMVTPLRRLAGLAHLLRLRRMLGADILKRPYITVGFTALLLLLPLALTSTKRMMRRLGRRWSILHRLVYVIGALGVWHYYWQEKRDVREPLLYAAVLALLLGYRAVHAWRQRHPAMRGLEETRA